MSKRINYIESEIIDQYLYTDQVDEEHNLKKAQFDQDKIQTVTKDIIIELISQPKLDHIIIDHEVQNYYVDNFKKLIKRHFFSDSKEIPKNFKEQHNISELSYAC